MSATNCNVSNLPESQIFWGALPAITRAAMAWRGIQGSHFGIFLINFWTAEPGLKNDLWAPGTTIRQFVLEAIEHHTTSPWEEACLQRILEIGVFDFTPAKTPNEGIVKQRVLFD